MADNYQLSKEEERVIEGKLSDRIALEEFAKTFEYS